MIETTTTPILDHAISAEISDGDFRTYAFICRLARRTHPYAERPYIDLDYAQLAHLHPGTNPLTASAVRARINRLVKGGLLKRERIDNICWRTYPTLDAPIAGNSLQTQPNWMSCPISPNAEMAHLGDRLDDGQANEESLGATTDDRQMQSTAGWVPPPITPNRDGASSGVISESTQHAIAEVPAMADNTQTSAEDGWVLDQITPSHAIGGSDGASKHQQDATGPLDVMPDGTQALPIALPATSDSSHSVGLLDQDQALDLDQSSNQRTATDAGELRLNDISPAHRPLADALAHLTPQAMSATGILECLQQPALTAAWLAYVLEPANGVRKPAAYLRKQVRRGDYPPLAPPPQQVEPIVPRRPYAASLSHDLYKSPSHPPACTSTVAVAEGRATRWPLDAS